MRWYVIGMGEVGRRLEAALIQSGFEAHPVTRNSGWTQAVTDPEGIRLVCVREEDLEGVLDRLEGEGGERIVVVQNGWIRPLLRHHPGAGRGLIWFTSKGEFFRALRPSVLSGAVAEPLAAALSATGIPAIAVPPEDVAFFEAEKMGFNCVVGLPLVVHGLSLAEYLEREPEEAEAVFREAVEATAAALGVAARPDWWSAFLTAVEPIGWIRPSAAKALDYRNGAVVRLAVESGSDVSTNQRLLRAAGWTA
jgi:ketopantoate reductase